MAKGKEPAQQEETSKACFFITPIGGVGSPERKRADWIFKHVLKRVCEERHLVPQRADIMSGSSMITTRIFAAIQNAPVCVADLTTLNANVMYELGVRHAFEKPVMHIAQNGTPLPFDNAQHDTFFYDLDDFDSLERLHTWLQKQFTEAMEDGHVVSNPLTSALGQVKLQISGDSRDQLISDISERLDRLESGRQQPRISGTFPIAGERPPWVEELTAPFQPEHEGAISFLHHQNLAPGARADTLLSNLETMQARGLGPPAVSFSDMAELLNFGSITEIKAVRNYLMRTPDVLNRKMAINMISKRYPNL